jgi:hypothetical protein
MNQKLDGHQDQADVSTTGLIIYGYINEPMPSIEAARRNKDAVFNSVFNMTKIQETCQSYELKFSQQIAIVPGLKTVRILGVKKNNTVPLAEPKKLSYSERVLNNANVIHEGQKSLQELKSQVAHNQSEVKLLKKELEDLLNYQNEGGFVQQLKTLRKDWSITDDKATLYEEIKKEKDLRDGTYSKINEIKNLLRQKKRLMYFQQVAIKFKAKIPVVDNINSS